VRKRKAKFNEEVQLAAAHASADRHHELIEEITGIKTALAEIKPSFHIPMPRNAYFSARGDLLQHMEQDLKAPTASDEKRTKSLALYRIGGVGKTQIALEYSYGYRKLYNFVFWIRAETDLELIESIVSIARNLSLVSSGEKLQLSVQKFLGWLGEAGKAPLLIRFGYVPDLPNVDNSWLLVLDNVTAPETSIPYWPRGDHGAVILTLQNPDVSSLVLNDMHVRSLELDEDGDLVLKNMRFLPPNVQAAQALSTELGGLPLAIAHFYAYINRALLSILEIWELFKNRRQTAYV
jgi:hypothetical protein